MPSRELQPIIDAATHASSVAAACAEEVDRTAAWPRTGIDALLDAGLGGLVVPSEYGGQGQGLYALARVCEIVGRSCASTAICFGMHSVASAVIAAKPTQDHIDRFLGPIVAGEHLTTLALSEPGTGSHFWIPETTVESDEDTLVIRGRKSFVTNGGFADSYVLNVVAPRSQRVGEFSCVLIDADAPQLTWGPPWSGIGMRGNSSRNLELDEVRVPATDMLGDPGDQIWYVFNVVAPYFLIAMAGTYLGIAGAALDDAIAWVGKRGLSDSGASVSGFDVAQFHIGEMWATVERSRALVRQACELGDTGSDSALPALCATKADVAECANAVVGGAMSLTGGSGYRENSAMGRRLRDARAAHVMSPTTDLLRLWTGRSLLGLPLLA